MAVETHDRRDAGIARPVARFDVRADGCASKKRENSIKKWMYILTRFSIKYKM